MTRLAWKNCSSIGRGRAHNPGEAEYHTDPAVRDYTFDEFISPSYMQRGGYKLYYYTAEAYDEVFKGHSGV